jgi:hypothetical protein
MKIVSFPAIVYSCERVKTSWRCGGNCGGFCSFITFDFAVGCLNVLKIHCCPIYRVHFRVWMRDDRNIVIVPSVNIFDSYFAIEYANSMRQDYIYDVARKTVVEVEEMEIDNNERFI